MTTAWFLILCGIVVTYAVLDGFDLGVGALLLLIAKNENEHQKALAAIGPVWNGNEVWLIVAGGAMVAAFPTLYAAGFSGFYLPLMLLLWLFIGRGLGYEFRHFEKNELWSGAADVVFSIASLLIALVFGLAVGNVLHGVPLDASHNFIGAFSYMLNPFAIVAGLLSVAVLSMHGAAFLTLRTDDALQERAFIYVNATWIASLVLTIILVIGSFLVSPNFGSNFIRWPWLNIIPLVVIGALIWIPIAARRKNAVGAFRGTAALIIGLLGSAAAGLYPVMLPALAPNAAYSLTIYNSAAGPHSLFTALCATVIALCIAATYITWIYRMARRA